MFGFTRRPGLRSPSAAILGALEKDGWPPGGEHGAALGVVESRGAYSGRKVTYIRVFDPARAAERGLKVEAFGDLDGHPAHIPSSQNSELLRRRRQNWMPPPAMTRIDEGEV